MTGENCEARGVSRMGRTLPGWRLLLILPLRPDRALGHRVTIGSIAVALAFAALAACSRSLTLPPPVFTETTVYPGFIVECRNTTAQPVSPLNPIAALRLDGAVIAAQGFIGSRLGGAPPDVPPGGTFKHRVILHPDKLTSTSSSGLEGTGAKRQTDWAVPLTKGRHSVAFQCLGIWTKEVSFRW